MAGTGWAGWGWLGLVAGAVSGTVSGAASGTVLGAVFIDNYYFYYLFIEIH